MPSVPMQPGSRAVAASRVRFRRAITLLVMTLLVPGSAQLAAGRRDVGRLALRVALSVVGGLAVVVVVGLMWHGFVYWMASNTVVLGFIRLLLCALAVGWALLFLDAWRLGRPLELQQKHRLAMVGLNGTLCFAVAGSLLFASHMVAVQKGFITAMFGDGTVTAAHDGRYNVLLLGGDSGADRWGLRPDSLTVASIDADTGKTILFGLPRNMMDFPFAKGSVMAGQFPSTYDCSTCELNSLATWAGDHKSLFKGYANPGVEATMEGVEGITGLKINYYAMVNLQGFRNMVQAVGGLTLNVRDRIPIGGVGGPVTGHIEPGVHRLNGYQTLWFARSRESADDYSRMARQKCVMNAMLQQLSPATVVTKFESIAKASEKLVTTDLPASELGRFAELAMKARSQPVRTVSFVPPAVSTSHPDVAKIQAMVRSAVDRAEGRAAARPAPAPTQRKGYSRSTHQTVGGSIGNLHDGYAANESSDLSSSC
ncbi:MAG: polyisoprenyl-teichoic acid--peptidoglycan teichoic acid transferase [Nocardioidaceae bacterium]|nr:polyisoprenyl-teichoic acid--peptidoglycan teichoic acid transferase [Nocardioidaceae bacterium]